MLCETCQVSKTWQVCVAASATILPDSQPTDSVSGRCETGRIHPCPAERPAGLRKPVRSAGISGTPVAL